MRERLKKYVLYLFHLVGFILLFLVIRKMEWGKFRDLFPLYQWWKYAVGLIILSLVYAMKSYRWMILNSTFNIRTGWRSTLVFYLSAGFLSVITPGRMGEFAKIYFLKRKYGISMSLATSSVILDRIWDILVLSFAACLYLMLILAESGISLLTLMLILLLFTGSLMLVVWPAMLFKPVLWLTKNHEKFHQRVRDIFSIWQHRRFSRFIPSLVITAAAFLMLASIPVLFSMDTPYPVQIKEGIGAISVSNILSFLPITIAGFGTRELVFSTIWELKSYPVEAAISISTVYFMVTYLGSLVIGGITYLLNLKHLYRPAELNKFRSA